MSILSSKCCFLCGGEGIIDCRRCSSVTACSKYHLDFHSAPNGSCFPFRIVENPLVGRCVVAIRDIVPGELLLQDSTVVYGQREDDGDSETLEEGITVPKHLAAQAKLLLQRSQNKDYHDLTELLIHHELQSSMNEFSSPLEGLLGSDSKEISRCQSLLDINALSLKDSGLRGFFPIFSFLSHSCQNNSRHVTSKAGKDAYVVKLYSQRAVQMGDELSITYTNLLRPTYRRRAHLSNVWRFTCSCSRCIDPTEAGSLLGALICPECKIGNLLLSEEIWNCNSCDKSMSRRDVEPMVDALEGILSETPREVEKIKEFLASVQCILHPNHYLQFLAKRLLMQLLPLDSSEETLSTRRSLCHGLLSVFDKLDGGLSASRGCTLFELGKSLLALGDVPGGISSLREAELCLEIEEMDPGIQGNILRQVRQTLKII